MPAPGLCMLMASCRTCSGVRCRLLAWPPLCAEVHFLKMMFYVHVPGKRLGLYSPSCHGAALEAGLGAPLFGPRRELFCSTTAAGLTSGAGGRPRRKRH